MCGPFVCLTVVLAGFIFYGNVAVLVALDLDVHQQLPCTGLKAHFLRALHNVHQLLVGALHNGFERANPVLDARGLDHGDGFVHHGVHLI